MGMLNLCLHPDAMFDMPYENHPLDAEKYRALKLTKPEVERKENGVLLKDGKAGMSVEVCCENIMRIRFSLNGNEFSETVAEKLEMVKPNLGGADFNFTFDNGKLDFTSGTMTFSYDAETNEFYVRDAKKGMLIQTRKGGARFSTEEAEYSGERMLTFFDLKSDEQIFGFGGRISHPNKTGTTVDVFPEKAGITRGDYGGFPLPYFVSTKKYAVFFANPWPHVYFDMGKTNPDEWFVHAPGGTYDLYVFTGDTIGDLVRKYTDLTGRPAMPRRWQLGLWCSSTKFFNAEETEENGRRMHREGYPCDVIVLDGSWRSGLNFSLTYSKGKGYPANDYDWHPDMGDGAGMLKRLKNEGIQIALHINSCSFKPETYEPAVEKGLLRQVGTEVVPQLSDEKGQKFYEKFLVPRIKEGCVQWWTDHSDRVSGEVAPGIPSRAIFGYQWNKFIAEVMEKYEYPNHMCLSRGGGIGSQRYAMPWPGDTAFGIDRFEEDLWFIQNIGLAGFSLSGYDLGGFTRPVVKEGTLEEGLAAEFDLDNVCRRICSSMLFVPIARVHSGDGLPKFPWNCPKETRKLYKEALEFRYMLNPYLYSYAIESHKSGEPIIRSLFYMNTDDERTYSIGDEFYLGENMLVAPVVKKNAVSRKVYLPQGKWTNLWNGERFDGGQTVMVDAPLKELCGTPMFVKDGGVIVRKEKSLFLADEAPKKLFIEFYGENAEIALWESNEIQNHFLRSSHSVHVENNFDFERTYVVRFAENGFEKEIIMKPNSETDVIV